MTDDALFTTARLRVRRWRPDDLAHVVAVYTDPEVVRFVGDGQPLQHAQCVEWMAVTARNHATRGYGMCLIEDRASGALVGFCGLVHPGGQPEPEIKYALHRSAWGRGLATEAVTGLLQHAAHRLRLDRVIATVAPGNLASQQVLRKAGARLHHTRTHPDGSSALVFEWQAGGPVATTRPATVDDASAIAAVQVASWQAAYSHLLPQAWLQAMSVPKRATQWAGFVTQRASDITVALQGDTVVGFASAGPSRDRDAPARTHELYALYVHPQHWSGGHGWRLWQGVERSARQAGAERCTLWVIVGNARGIRFYERVGFSLDPGSRQRFEIDGTPLDEDRYLRPIGPAPAA